MEEELTDKQILRIAQSVLNCLAAARVAKYGLVLTRLESLANEVARVHALRRRLGIAAGRCWHAAADKTVSTIPEALRDIPYHIGEVEQACKQSEAAKLPTLGEIAAELQQLNDEFDRVQYDRERHTLSVTTDRIELDDVYLGEFEIRLEIPRLEDHRRYSTYRVVALDPHPAASNDSVTHPHVSDEHLCEGDAGAAIGAALANGRICDFFMLVRSVLQHYNPNSPYVSLADWQGSPCHECGSTLDENDTHCCHSCEEYFCDDCTSYCRRCDETTCIGCLETCEACGESVCSSCRTTCDECGRTLCLTCQEEGKCPCIKEREDREEAQPQNQEPAAVAVGAAAAPDTPAEGAITRPRTRPRIRRRTRQR